MKQVSLPPEKNGESRLVSESEGAGMMPVEIERRFLVTGDSWRGEVKRVRRIRQGFLSLDPDRLVRVRQIDNGEAFLTIKGRAQGFTRPEIEFPIPVIEASALLAMCLPAIIDKTRHEIDREGFTWEIDEFHCDNAGLIVAEIELPSEDARFELPSWLGCEVSTDPRFTNAHLATHPYTTWSAPA